MYYMIEVSTITSKGTITIPSRIRELLQLKPGQKVRFEEDPKTGEIRLKRAMTIEELHELNKKYLPNLEKALNGRDIDDFIDEGMARQAVARYKRSLE